jgi:ferredoxin
MPTILFQEKTIECPLGANLRMVMIRARLPLYNSAARALNCRGRGTCGTCAVRVEGNVSEPTREELRRLAFAPHKPDSGLRLACQCTVLGDLKITKHEGLWGQRPEIRGNADSRGR